MNVVGSRRWWALGAITLAVLAVGLDGTVLSVALPTLATSLHASESDLQWFTSGYLLVLAAAMLPAGLLGDRFGRKKVMAVSLALFGIGSAACAFSTTAGEFIAARVLLGLAGAGIVVMALAAVTVLFTEEERPRAVGIWSGANFLALPIGPILGGWLLTNYWWGWVFLMNVPVALVGLIAALALVPESRAPKLPGLDLVGIVSSTAGLVAVVYGLIEAGQNGWAATSAVVPLVVGILILLGFLLWERRLSRIPGGEPLVDLGLFKSASYTWGVLLAAVGGMALIGVLFTMPQYFQGVLGVDAMGSGLRLLPLIGGLVLGAVPADRVAHLLGTKIAIATGFTILAVGLVVGATTAIGSSGGFVAVWMAVVGLGMGLTFATAASAALSELSAERSGVGSAVMQALQKVGGPLGAAILGSVLSTSYQNHLPLAQLPLAVASIVRSSLFAGIAVAEQLRSVSLLAAVRGAFVSGMDVSLLVASGIAVAGLLLALLFMPRRSAKVSDNADTREPVAASEVQRVELEHEQGALRG